MSFAARFADLARFLDVTSLADLGCGDFSWMEPVSGQFALYLGLDRDAALIARLDERHRDRPGHFFAGRDVARDPVPKVDAVLCRDLFSENDVATVQAILAGIKASGSRYLVASTTPGAPAPLDLTAAPFNLPLPLLQFQESPDSAKLLGVWQIPGAKPNP